MTSDISRLWAYCSSLINSSNFGIKASMLPSAYWWRRCPPQLPYQATTQGTIETTLTVWLSIVATHGDGTWTPKVYNALDVGSWCVDGGVQRESELVDAKTDATSTNIEHITTHVNLHQARRRHLVMQHAERRYQEVLVVLADTTLKTFRPSQFITRFWKTTGSQQSSKVYHCTYLWQRDNNKKSELMLTRRMTASV